MLLNRIALVSFAFCCSLLASTASAAGAQVKTQGPGYYRSMLGDYELTVLLDGVIDLELAKIVRDMPAAEVNAHLERAFQDEKVPISDNAFLVNTGTRLVLVDAGAGSAFGAAAGKLPASLRASGYQPEQIDDILITHMHADHVGGLIVDGKMAFPNAIVHADQHDADFWLSAEQMEKAPAEAKDFFKAAQAALGPYVAAGKFKTFDGNVELFPGIKAIAARGHTPGHSFYSIESKGAKLVLWGDLVHVAAVQFEKPSVTVNFDVDPKSAAATRKGAFADAAKERFLIGAAHLPFPGLGHLRVDGKGYAYVPVDYDPVR